MMNLLVSRWRILRGIERDLADSDPLLTGLFTMFTWLTHGEEMPAAKKLRAGSVRKLAWLRSAAGPNRPLEHWRTWFWTSLLFAILVALPYSVTMSLLHLRFALLWGWLTSDGVVVSVLGRP